MTGYTRQQFYADEDTILAEHTNDEFDRIQEAFHEVTGHTHDGTAAGGGAIKLIQDGDGDTRVVLDETPDNDEVSIYAGGVKRVAFTTTGLEIGGRFNITYNATNDTLDIGVI